MSDSIDFFKKISEIVPLLKKNLEQFVGVVYDSREFIRKLNPHTQEHFYQALTFAAFTSFLNFLIWSMFLNVDLKTVMLLTDTLITYMFWLTYGLFFYWSFRLVKGEGEWKISLSSFLYLTAFIPIISFVSIPHEILRQELMADGLVPGSLKWADAIYKALIHSPLSIDSISWLLGRMLWVLLLFRLIQVLRVVHKLTIFRSIIALVIGLVLTVIVQSTFQNYILWLLWNNWNG